MRDLPEPGGSLFRSFTYFHYVELEAVRDHIRDCEGRCVQQVVYSTYHDALTQICFTEGVIRSTLMHENGFVTRSPAMET